MDYDDALVQIRVSFNVSIRVWDVICVTYCCDNQLYLTLLLCEMQFFLTCFRMPLHVTLHEHGMNLLGLNLLRIPPENFTFNKRNVYVDTNVTGKTTQISEFSFMNIRRKFNITNTLYKAVANDPIYIVGIKGSFYLWYYIFRQIFYCSISIHRIFETTISLNM